MAGAINIADTFICSWQYNSPRSSFKELLWTSHFPRTNWEEPEQSQTLDDSLSFFLIQSRWKDGGIKGAGFYGSTTWGIQVNFSFLHYKRVLQYFFLVGEEPLAGSYYAAHCWGQQLVWCGGGIIWKRSSQVRKAWSRKPLQSPLKSHICNPPENKHSDICNMGIPSVDAVIKQPRQGDVCLLFPPPHSGNKWVGQRRGSIMVIL